jgi:hypothetical protein
MVKVSKKKAARKIAQKKAKKVAKKHVVGAGGPIRKKNKKKA